MQDFQNIRKNFYGSLKPFTSSLTSIMHSQCTSFEEWIDVRNDIQKHITRFQSKAKNEIDHKKPKNKKKRDFAKIVSSTIPHSKLMKPHGTKY